MAMKSPTGPEARHRVQEACASARTVLSECKGDQHVLAVAFQGAVIAFELCGNAETVKGWKKDATALHQGLKAVERHKDRIIDRLALNWFRNPETGTEIGMMHGTGAEHVIPAEAVFNVVIEVIEAISKDIDQPPAIFRARRDASFLRLLGIEFRNRSLPRPTAKRLRALHEIGTGESFTGDDAAAIHAFGD